MEMKRHARATLQCGPRRAALDEGQSRVRHAESLLGLQFMGMLLHHGAMHCPRCQRPNDPDARFCLVCAAPLAGPAPIPKQPAAHPQAPPMGWAPPGMGAAPPTVTQRGFAPTATAGAAPLASPKFSAWLEGYVTFDGEVLEQFHFRDSLCRRQHIATIVEARFDQDGGRQYIEVRTAFDGRLWIVPFRPQQKPLADQLLMALKRAIR